MAVRPITDTLRLLEGGTFLDQCSDEMATGFIAQGERALKSAVNTQDGGVRMTFVDANNNATETVMNAFKKFRIAIPVFKHQKKGYRIDAWLRFRVQQNTRAVIFWYELQRPDKAHQLASDAIIKTVREGLPGVPFYFGQ